MNGLQAKVQAMKSGFIIFKLSRSAFLYLQWADNDGRKHQKISGYKNKTKPLSFSLISKTSLKKKKLFSSQDIPGNILQHILILLMTSTIFIESSFGGQVNFSKQIIMSVLFNKFGKVQ